MKWIRIINSEIMTDKIVETTSRQKAKEALIDSEEVGMDDSFDVTTIEDLKNAVIELRLANRVIG